MAIVTEEVLKSYFNTGDVPTEAQMVNLIDSLVHSLKLQGFESRAGDTTLTYNIIANPFINQLDGGSQNVILGGRQGFENRLISNTDLRFIFGYNNQIGASIASGIVGGMHCIQEGASTGHSWTLGGSYIKMKSRCGYSISLGGTNNISDEYNVLDGAFSLLGPGENINLEGTGRNIFITGKNSSIISQSGTNMGAIIGENLNVDGGTDFFIISASDATFSGVNGGIALYVKNATAADVNHPLLSGQDVKAINDTQEVRANGKFAEIGDAQVSRYVMMRAIDSSSFQEMRLNRSFGGLSLSGRIKLEDGKAYTLCAEIIGKNADLSVFGSFSIKGCMTRTSGVVTVHNTIKEVIHRTSTSLDVDMSHISGNALVRVKGDGTGVMNWVANVIVTEVK